MLDPLLLACVLAVLAGIIAIVFYLFSGNDDERDFERAFGENARKLFHHDREKHKSKVKLGKKKEVKERKNEPKLDAVIETETAATYEQSSELIDAVASSTATSVKTTAINSNDKKQISKDEKDQIAEFNNDEANMKSIFILGNEVNLPRETSIDENKENQNEQTSYCEGYFYAYIFVYVFGIQSSTFFVNKVS
ncbi:hypothetical protein DICVIV_08961 [Dictyocaulus viviparus]|uniref:Uncharacterized protein n=1 Tax=Dictyocaulus viviparus TaxID=29172 RepID=A0A0D8XRH7_DICVI|nr:hypothetical protein DICVIV_08961 [Dictyocaulus viviparus]